MGFPIEPSGMGTAPIDRLSAVVTDPVRTAGSGCMHLHSRARTGVVARKFVSEIWLPSCTLQVESSFTAQYICSDTAALSIRGGSNAFLIPIYLLKAAGSVTADGQVKRMRWFMNGDPSWRCRCFEADTKTILGETSKIL